MSNNEQSESKGTSIEQPWRISQKGAVYCIWENLPDEVRSQLKHEDGFKTKLGDFSYHVKKNENGGHIVFRNAIKARVEYRNIQSSFKRSLYRTVEVKYCL
jgi:hypothetical protein